MLNNTKKVDGVTASVKLFKNKDTSAGVNKMFKMSIEDF